MSRCDDLLATIRNNPRNADFKDVLRLAECWGFVGRSGGNHPHFYKRPGFRMPLNFQKRPDGKAKVYQVNQLLTAIAEIEEEGRQAQKDASSH